MRTHCEMPWLWRSIVSIACTLPASACVDAIVGELDVCEHEGKGYTLNEKFSAKDGCNECTCTIDGEVECTERACEPAMGCDEKDGCEDGGSPYADAGGPVCDPKLGCKDAGPYADAGISGPPGYCKYNGTIYKLGEKFRGVQDCGYCWCDMLGNVLCTHETCFEPDGGVAPGTCEYAGKVYTAGARFSTTDNCNTCECRASGVVACTVGGCSSDAGVDDGGYSDAGVGMPVPDAGSCLYKGASYQVGQGFDRGDNCNKCTCVSEGVVECSSTSCAPPPGCNIGNQLVHYGESVTCEDGCNTCTCAMDATFTRTEQACPDLPGIQECGAPGTGLQIPAPLTYLSGNVLAVPDPVSSIDQCMVFSLCYSDVVSTMGSEVAVFVVPGTETRPCIKDRVFSLVPLRDDYNATFPEREGGKIILRGHGSRLLYQFGM